MPKLALNPRSSCLHSLSTGKQSCVAKTAKTPTLTTTPRVVTEVSQLTRKRPQSLSLPLSSSVFPVLAADAQLLLQTSLGFS